MSDVFNLERFVDAQERDYSTICSALNYIGIVPDDFALQNAMFARPVHAPIHGIGHIYRTMIGCALLGELLQKPRDGLLAFCGAFVHDLARENDGVDSEHGANAALKYFDKFNNIWDKYQLTTQEREVVKQAVEQHSTREWMRCGDVGYDVMAILKDADALDRCRIGDLDPQWLRYRDSRFLIRPIEAICDKTYSVNDDIDFSSFIQMIS